MTSPDDGRRAVGDQSPRIDVAPPAPTSAGEDVIEVARLAGIALDPWQQYALTRALGGYDVDPVAADDDGWRWAAFVVGLVVSRQNGKGGLLEARQLGGLYVLGEGLQTHTAHLFPTALEHFHRVLAAIERCPELDAKVRRVTRSHGEEGIELKSGGRLHFRARTGKGGRGFSGDTVYLDEAMLVPPAALSSLMPTMATRRAPQLWYSASAADLLEHDTCHALADVRARALAGSDPSLCYLEWSPDYEGPDKVAHLCDPDRTPPGDPELEAAIAAANPALGIRISREHIEKERRSMTARSFAVERLSVGDWPRATGADRVITAEVWATLRDPLSQPGPSVAFGVDVAPDRSASVLGVASRRADGRLHVEVVDARPGTGWVVGRVAELVQRWNPCAMVLDKRSAVMSLEADLLEHDIEPDVTTAHDMATAAGEVHDAVHNDRLRHLGQPELDEPVAAARTRPLGDAFAWDRRGTTPITGLVAVTLAAWGVVHRAAPTPPPAPQAVPASDTARAPATADLLSAGF